MGTPVPPDAHPYTGTGGHPRTPARRRAWLAGVATLLLAAHAAAAPPVFTEDERAWIAAHPVVRYSGNPTLAPIESEVDGEYRGLARGYLDAVAARSGLRFEYVPSPGWDAARAALRDGRIDLLPNYPRIFAADPTDRGLLLGTPYIGGVAVLVARHDAPMVFSESQLAGRRVAVIGGGAFARWLAERVPSAIVVPRPDPDALMRAVADGDADVGMGSELLLLPLLRRRHYDALGVAGTVPSMAVSASMAVRAADAPLARILDRSLASLTAADTDRIDRRELASADYGAPSAWLVLRHYRWPLLGTLAGIALLLLFWVRARRARARAEASEVAKARFLAVMSHEIRTPMNAVLGAVEMLQQTGLGLRQQRLADSAAEAGEAMLELLDGVLDLSKLEAGGVHLAPRPTDVSVLGGGVVEAARAQVRDRPVSVSLELAATAAGEWMVDPMRLRQVLANLLSNAVKFTERGTVVLRVAAREEAGGTQLLLAVADTGAGIEATQQARLFQPFVQADDTHVPGGTGLGLAICRELVERMGGRIGLDSAPGRGTTVWVHLPAVRPAGAGAGQPAGAAGAARPAAAAAAEGTRPATGAVHAGPHVLVVDDHPGNRYILGEQLRVLGASAVLAADGAEALHQLRTAAFSLVLMDGYMPVLDGYETTRQLRQEERRGVRARVPVVGISAATDAGHAARCHASGMDAVARKPLRLDDLRALLEQFATPVGGAFPHAVEAGAGELAAIDLRALFREALRNDLLALEEAVAATDAVAIGHCTHRFKGAAAMAGAMDVCEELVSLEQVLAEGDDVAPLLASVREALDAWAGEEPAAQARAR